ncbi:hypothetical protein FVR03_21095 [Pontibacter qinzhouensis]|uniref:Uncharacterized protein n=1 Tax=Pontibacter qinzhouensis TaxID=2603253 RepID=A0A5C8J1T5_9BACT|nr:hypothetical protein [Pontibacter qinzhouensis]TXK27728.1 hypothetical protein FVR03_21095 [Pontibacter qinzhouensis]
MSSKKLWKAKIIRIIYAGRNRLALCDFLRQEATERTPELGALNENKLSERSASFYFLDFFGSFCIKIKRTRKQAIQQLHPEVTAETETMRT